MILLADNDCEGYVHLLWGTLEEEGWIELLDLEMATFRSVGLSSEANDREIWHFAQSNRMILVTNNRNAKDENSLARTLRDENQLDSLPVLTFGNVRRLYERAYRMQCATAVAEVVFELEKHLGRGRIFIP